MSTAVRRVSAETRRFAPPVRGVRGVQRFSLERLGIHREVYEPLVGCRTPRTPRTVRPRDVPKERSTTCTTHSELSYGEGSGGKFGVAGAGGAARRRAASLDLLNPTSPEPDKALVSLRTSPVNRRCSPHRSHGTAVVANSRGKRGEEDSVGTAAPTPTNRSFLSVLARDADLFAASRAQHGTCPAKGARCLQR